MRTWLVILIAAISAMHALRGAYRISPPPMRPLLLSRLPFLSAGASDSPFAAAFGFSTARSSRPTHIRLIAVPAISLTRSAVHWKLSCDHVPRRELQQSRGGGEGAGLVARGRRPARALRPLQAGHRRRLQHLEARYARLQRQGQVGRLERQEGHEPGGGEEALHREGRGPDRLHRQEVIE